MSSPSSRDYDKQLSNVIQLILDVLERLGFDPRLVPSRRIDSLRGGVASFILSGRAVDASVLLSKTRLEDMHLSGSALFKVDYAVRGDIKGILPGRIVSKTKLDFRGLIRKRLEGLKWETPFSERPADYRMRDQRSLDEGIPPGPGELWEGSPHKAVTDRLNKDSELIESIKNLIERKTKPTWLSVISDRWGSSIRVRGSIWMEHPDFMALYLNPTYLEIVENICGHIKEVRRSFGGIAF